MKTYRVYKTLLASLLAAATFSAAAANKPAQEEWVDLFNGKDFSNWTVKLKGYPAGENAFDTFRVTDGLLQARYDKYETFGKTFGHI